MPVGHRVFSPATQRLIDEYAAAVRELTILHQQQFHALINQDDPDRFDILIHMTNERKHQAKYALLEHVGKHGWG